jgi:uncharacterized protein YbaR (Trm112 family)
MLKKHLDLLECPICQEAKRLWTISEGDLTDTRIANGKITCPQGHVWKITEDILRMDKESSVEEMIFNDRPLTGFPSEPTEGERGYFLMEFEKLTTEFIKFSDKPLIVKGNSVLFFKYVPTSEREIIVVHPDEGVLRQIQELVAKKMIYNQISFIRSEDAQFIPIDSNTIHIFPESTKNMKPEDFVATLDPTMQGETYWTGESSSLILHQK